MQENFFFFLEFKNINQKKLSRRDFFNLIFNLFLLIFYLRNNKNFI